MFGLFLVMICYDFVFFFNIIDSSKILFGIVIIVKDFLFFRLYYFILFLNEVFLDFVNILNIIKYFLKFEG